MTEVFDQIMESFLAQSGLEMLAVLLGVAYLVLAMRQNNLCWYAAFGSTAIFSWLFWDVSLVMESALNVYYLIMAIYGWWVWRHGGASDTSTPSETLPIRSWGWRQHLLIMTGIAALTLISGYLLARNTSAALPYLDSFTTWGAVITTWMVTRKILENWLYWIVIDAAAIYLYSERELYLTAALMALYVVLAIAGWFLWLRDYHQQGEVDSRSVDPGLG